MPDSPTISVMLTCYKRPELLQRQLEAVRLQTPMCDELVIWTNGTQGTLYAGESHIRCDKNWGVWPRFTFAQHLPGDYLAVFDDDSIPGPKWFANCLATMKVLGPALLGSCGVLFPESSRLNRQYAGWKDPCDEAVEVDIVGHAWFFPRELLRMLSSSEIPTGCATCGEDYALAFAAQKMGWKTYCPPHPPNDKDLWGSVDGMKLGDDEHALWRQDGEEQKKADWHQRMLDEDWKPEALA